VGGVVSIGPVGGGVVSIVPLGGGLIEIGGIVPGGGVAAVLPATMATCHAPPKLEMPSPLVSPGAVSFEKRYSGEPFSVTCTADMTDAVPRPVTPEPPIAVTMPGGNSNGGQKVAH